MNSIVTQVHAITVSYHVYYQPTLEFLLWPASTPRTVQQYLASGKLHHRTVMGFNPTGSLEVDSNGTSGDKYFVCLPFGIW